MTLVFLVSAGELLVDGLLSSEDFSVYCSFHGQKLVPNEDLRLLYPRCLEV
jgi:hypothetical protein